MCCHLHAGLFCAVFPFNHPPQTSFPQTLHLVSWASYLQTQCCSQVMGGQRQLPAELKSMAEELRLQGLTNSNKNMEFHCTILHGEKAQLVFFNVSQVLSICSNFLLQMGSALGWQRKLSHPLHIYFVLG